MARLPLGLQVLVVAGVFVLSACGSDKGDRIASGTGIGAATGAVVGAVTGLTVVEGALIGAGAGALLGAVTDDETINFGDPIWADGDRPANKAAVSRVQAGLAKLGYHTGPVDGILGYQTRLAIENYQRDHALLVDGRPSLQLAQHIENNL